MRRWGWRLISRLGAVLLLGLFLLIISLPNLIDLENFRPQLLAYLHSRILGEVAIGKLKLTFAHGPGVRVDGIRVVENSGSQQISVTTAIVNFDFIRLLQRHLHPCRVTLVQPRVSLQLDKGSLPLAGFIRPVIISAAPIETESADPPLPKGVASHAGDVGAGAAVGFFKYWYFDSDISQALVEIVDGSVTFTDRCFGVSLILTHLEDLNVLLEWQKSGAPTQFTLAARVVDGPGDGSLKIEGSLSSLQWPLRPGEMFLDCQVEAKNLNAATYFPYYQKYVPMRFIGARVDIDSTYRGSLMGLFRSQGRIVLHQAELDYQQVFNQKLKFKRFAVDYDFRLADRYNTIETLSCAIDADGLKLKGYCLLHEARRGIDGSIKAGLEMPEFDPLAISHLLPWKILPEKILNYYQFLQSGGGCLVESAYLKGDYRKIVRLAEKNPPTGVVGGQLKAKNLLFKIAEDWPHLAVGAGNVVFEGGSLKISDLDFDWDALSGEAVNLSLQNIFHDPQIKCACNLGVDLKRLQPYCERFFHDIPEEPSFEKRSAISYSGFLQGDLVFAGPLTKLSEITWGGILKGQDLAFAVAGQPLAINRGDASFVLANERIIIENASCYLASLPLTLQGRLPGPALWFSGNGESDLKFEFRAQTQEFAPEHLDLFLGEKFSVSGKKIGPSPLELHLIGDLKHFSELQLLGTLSLDWADVKLPFMAESFEHLNCLAEFNHERIDFKRLFIEHGESDLACKGELIREEKGSGYIVHGEVVADHILVDDFLALEKKASEKRVVVKELMLPAEDGSEKGRDRRAPWHHLNDFAFSFSGGPEAGLAIKECRWGWGGQEAQVEVFGQLRYLGGGLTGALEIDVQKLDLDTLFSAPDEVHAVNGVHGVDSNPDDQKIRAVLLEDLAEAVKADGVELLLSWKDILARNHLHVQARAQHLRWQQMEIGEIEGDCTLDALGVNFKKITGSSFGGGLNASAQWSYRDDSFALESQLSDIDFETFNDYLKNPDRGLPMQGGYGSLNLDLDWKGGSLQAWKENLAGQFDFAFYDGRLKKFTLLANVCSLLNLSQFAALRLPEISVDQGVPYQTLSGQGTIVDGVLVVDDFAMRGSSLNLLCDGVISLVEEQVDLKIGVQPLQTVDKLLATIPVVGYIITGDQKTFVVIPMTATGSFEDIKIKTHTVSGLGQKAGDMIQRFFKTPVRLLRMPGKLLNQISSENDLEKDSGVEKK